MKAADGTTHYPDGAIAGFPRPPALPQTLRAGATVHSVVGVPVRWRSLVAQVLVLTPPGLQGVQKPTSPLFQAIAWEFVVIWDWNGTGFGPAESLTCGGGVITVGTGPELDFVSACST